MRFTINHRAIDVTRQGILECVAGVQPEQPLKYVALIGNDRFPPKQVINLLTGWDRQSYTTEDAQRLLRRLGFQIIVAAESIHQPSGSSTDLASRLAVVEAASTTMNLAIAALAARVDALQAS